MQEAKKQNVCSLQQTDRQRMLTTDESVLENDKVRSIVQNNFFEPHVTANVTL